MRKNFGVIFATSGIIMTLVMFMNILSNVQSQLEMDNDVIVISAFAG